MVQEDILGGAISQIAPKWDLYTALGWGGVFLAIIVIGIALTVFTIFILNYFRFNKHLRVFGKVGNKTTQLFLDKGAFERIGMAGDYWCRTKKSKKYLPRPRIQMAKNEYWYYIREDGEWINFSLEDIDAQMKAAKVYYVEEDMRLQRLGIQKNLEARFKKITFWERYGGMITTGVFLLIITICLVVIFREMKGAWTGATEMAGAVKEMALQLHNIQGSGAIPK